MTVTLEDIKRHPYLQAYILQADSNLRAMGYTEHGHRHINLVSSIAHNILVRLGFPERKGELAAIAGYLHDIGNCVGRIHHGASSALLIGPILREMGMPADELGLVLSAVGNHEEEVGEPVNEVAAALILADKSDVHRTRVRIQDKINFDIHDRVNYAVVKSFLDVNEVERAIVLRITIETEHTSIMEYFEIFLERMLMCRRAAAYLNCEFNLVINDVQLL
ncbi:MAG: HD domain-containing protein [Firmicutes bacterium]|jgi:metal-dependent HD superfamily phosphatase/phosphodiesterase|nr:HD domain-containing protein [Bacillota bacterium]NLO65233.1 HD domain-containing protein [Bacillota bacterium]